MIDFAEDITTAEALKYIFRLQWIVVKNTARAINNAAHKWPWAFIVVILLASFLTSFVMIGNARAERDEYSKTSYQLQQSLDSCKVILEVRR